MKELINNRRLRIFAITTVLLCVMFALATISVNAATLSATAKINCKDGAVLRKSASTSSTSIKVIKDNAKITIKKEVFTSKNKAGKTYRWYYVTYGSKTGYVRSDLVDTIKYTTTIKGKALDNLNYRSGAGTGTGMKVIGTLNKGTIVNKVLKVKAYGSDETWYKIKKGSKYYYVCGTYVGAVSNDTTTSDDTKTGTTEPTTVALTLSGANYPVKLIKAQAFTISGTLSCNTTIEKVRIGVKNSSNDWVDTVKVVKEVNAKTFSVSSVDAAVVFGKLAKGSYTYCIDAYVNGKWYNKLSESFTVVTVSANYPKKIAEKAIELAWPVGTDSSVYLYKTKKTTTTDDGEKKTTTIKGSATEAFNTAFDTVFPTHSSWKGTYTKVGADCGVFVATVIRDCGYDAYFPYSLTGTDTMFTYLENDTKNWMRVSYSGDDSQLQNGDIIIYKKDSGGQHVLIYTRINGVGYMCEAANTGTATTCKYGYCKKATSKIYTLSDKTLYVYRAIR